MFLDNNWYGHRFILAEYCGIKDRPSFSSIQHGWAAYYNEGFFAKQPDGSFGSNKRLNFPYLVWSNEIEEKCNKNGLKNVHSIGSPFIYLCEILKTNENDNYNQNHSGVLFFPSHNTIYHKDAWSDHDLIITEIEKISEGPYTVCFYYEDIKSKEVDIYRKRNWNIISCGSRNDKHMLYKQYMEIIKHKMIITTEVCTPLFYGMFLKKKTKLLKSINNKKIFDRIESRLDKSTVPFDYKSQAISYEKYEKKLIEKYPSIINEFLDENKGFEIAKNELGLNSKKSSQELKKLLGWSSFFKSSLSNIIYIFFNIKYGNRARTGQHELKILPKNK